MAKRVIIPEGFSEADFIAAFKSPTSTSAREPPQPTNESRKQHPPIRRLAEEYLATFGRETDESFSSREGKSLNIRNEHHRKIREITQTFHNGRISISAYIDNILKDHFERFDAELKELDRQHPRF
ncbi:MAG: DUF3408 domain-containing protein [Rikenellaceae bacterium]